MREMGDEVGPGDSLRAGVRQTRDGATVMMGGLQIGGRVVMRREGGETLWMW